MKSILAELTEFGLEKNYVPRVKYAPMNCSQHGSKMFHVCETNFEYASVMNPCTLQLNELMR